MLVLLHIDKEQIKLIQESCAGVDPPVPPIEWCTRGSGGPSDNVVVLYDLERLVKDLLPQFGFPPITESSFVRKLCRWGFQQVSSAYGGVQKDHSNRPNTSQLYECKHFRRGNFAFLSRMRSDTAEKRRYQAKIAAERGGPEVTSNSDNPPGGQSPSLDSKCRGRKRSRTDLKRDDQPVEPQSATLQTTATAGFVAHSTLANEDTEYNHRPVPTTTAALPSRSLFHARPGAVVSQDIGAAAFAQSPFFGFLQQHVQPSAIHPARSFAGAQALRTLQPNGFERFQILQALGFSTLASMQHQTPLSVASLAAASLISPAAQSGTSTQRAQFGDQPQLPIASSIGTTISGAGQQRSSTTHCSGRPTWSEPYLQPILASSLFPALTGAEPPQQHIGRPRSNLTLEELRETLQRAQQPRQSSP
jgi:hypothetical protein